MLVAKSNSAFLQTAPYCDELNRKTVSEAKKRELLDHIRKFKGSIDLQGMTSDEFFKMLRD